MPGRGRPSRRLGDTSRPSRRAVSTRAAHPGGHIDFGSTDLLLCTLKAEVVSARWKLATGSEVPGTLMVKHGVVYTCRNDRRVYALDAEKGTGTARATGDGPLALAGAGATAAGRVAACTRGGADSDSQWCRRWLFWH